MSALLVEAGYAVQVADPREVRTGLPFHPDVVIVGSSGARTAGEVKAVAHTFPITPVVVASHGLTHTSAARAIEAGATAWRAPG